MGLTNSIIFKQPIQAQEKLDKLISKSEHLLLKISSIRLLDPCPDMLTIDENKVNIFHNNFFGSGDAHCILIENITSVTSNSTPFSSNLEIIDSTNERSPATYLIQNLKNSEAHQARKLIQGLMVAKKAGVELREFEDLSRLEMQLEKLGDSIKTF